MFEALKKYAVFTGRARRKEYWLFILLWVLTTLVASFIDVMVGTNEMVGIFGDQIRIGVLGLLVSLGFFIPSISVLVRRLHDTEMSGWAAILILLPGLGALGLLICCIEDGTAGKNQFGEDPKSAERATA